MSFRLPRKQTPILSRVRFQAAFERQPTQLPSTPSRRPPFISSCVWPKISLHGPTNPHGSYRLRRAVMSREEKKRKKKEKPAVILEFPRTKPPYPHPFLRHPKLQTTPRLFIQARKHSSGPPTLLITLSSLCLPPPPPHPNPTPIPLNLTDGCFVVASCESKE